MADAQWNERADIMEEKILQHTTAPCQNNGTGGNHLAYMPVTSA
jgi:hypothetical protein